jgi:polyhydroxybutyrate depolymerase
MKHNYTVATAVGHRTYLVHAPPADGPLPVVVMLHGAGGTALWALRETRWGEHADRHGFLLVLPDAARADPAEPAGFLLNAQVWNDGAADGVPERPDVDDVGFVTTVLDEVAVRFEIDRSRVYLTGFSNGAAMAFRLAAERPERFAAVAPVAGYCHVGDRRLARPVPTLYLTGRVDPLVPFDGGEVVTPWGRKRVVRPPVRATLERWALVLGCQPTARAVDARGGVTIEEYPGPVPFLTYAIDGLGHHWPGGRGEFNHRIAGPPSDRVDACAVIREFFCGQQIG